MSLKTEKTQKLRREKRYYTDFGKIKYFNIANDFILLLILIIIAFFLIEIFGLMLNAGFDFVNYLNLKTFKNLTISIFSNFWDLKNSSYWFDRVIYYYILLSVYIIVFYLIYLSWQIKKANVLSKLSNLGLENYKLRVKKDGLLFLIKRGEELDFSKFQDENLENIRQVFNKYFSSQDELIVERYKSKGFYIKKVKLKVQEFNPRMLKKGQIYFGRGLRSGDIYLKISEITHFLIVGQSGAGKSVFQNLLINQMIFNLKNGVEALYLVDLKGGVEFLQYQKFKNVEVITDVPQLLNLSRFLIQKMDERYQKMIEKGWKNWRDGQIIIMIDEYASVNDQAQMLTKEEEKELKNNLRTLLAKARAAGIKFFVAPQKATSDSIDTTLRENLQSKILMRTVSKDAQRVVIPKEELEELGVQPAKFGKGRFVLFGEKILDLMQSPYVKENFYQEVAKFRPDLVEKNKVKNKSDLGSVALAIDEKSLKTAEIESKNEEKVENLVENQDLSYHEAEADNFCKNEDGEIGGSNFCEKIEAEASDNLSPISDLKRAIEFRKELYKKTNNIEDKKLKANIRRLIKEIKYKQENENISCLEDLKRIEEEFFKS